MKKEANDTKSKNEKIKKKKMNQGIKKFLYRLLKWRTGATVVASLVTNLHMQVQE
jgi:hypothetical protein